MAQLAAADWLGVPSGHPFGLAALPYGVFSTADRHPELRIGVLIGDQVLDLTAATARLLPGRAHLFSEGSLNPFLAAGDGAWAQVRADLITWLTGDTYRVAVEDLLVPVAAAEHAHAVRGGRLRGLLRVRAPRPQRRADLPARRRAAAGARLDAPARPPTTAGPAP